MRLPKNNAKEPYSKHFVHYSDHLPKLLQGIFNAAYLNSNYSQLLTLAESYFREEITPAMVDHLLQITCDESKLKYWFQYIQRITAS